MLCTDSITDGLTTQFDMLPPWLVAALNKIWAIKLPAYKVDFENGTDEILDFVLAYETMSGIVLILQTRVTPGQIGLITCDCPCWDMKSYAWSVWGIDDVELYRSKTFTPAEVNAEEKIKGTYKECHDSFLVAPKK